jgi:hypothetical protein
VPTATNWGNNKVTVGALSFGAPSSSTALSPFWSDRWSSFDGQPFEQCQVRPLPSLAQVQGPPMTFPAGKGQTVPGWKAEQSTPLPGQLSGQSGVAWPLHRQRAAPPSAFTQSHAMAVPA